MNFLKKKIIRLNLNIFDYIIVFIILAIIATLFYLRFTKVTQWINVRIVASNEDWWWEGQAPQYWYADQLKVGQVAYNSLGEKIAEITDIINFDINGYKRRLYTDIKLKGSYDKNRQMYLFNYQPLQIGKILELTFGKNNLKGLVIYIDNKELEYSFKEIEVKIYKVRSVTAMSYKADMEMKDMLDRVLAHVESVEIDPATEYEFSDLRGQMIQVVDPDYKDVTMKLKIKTFQSGNRNYFIDRTDLKIGEKIGFQFPQAVVIEAEITKIFE